MERPSWVTSAVLPCTGSPTLTRPPKASAIAWWPRQTPSTGIPSSANRRLASIETPASTGRQGPGEITTRSGRDRSSSSTVATSFRTTSGSAPSSPRYWTRL